MGCRLICRLQPKAGKRIENFNRTRNYFALDCVLRRFQAGAHFHEFGKTAPTVDYGGSKGALVSNFVDRHPPHRFCAVPAIRRPIDPVKGACTNVAHKYP
jgi:hypothetical protein